MKTIVIFLLALWVDISSSEKPTSLPKAVLDKLRQIKSMDQFKEVFNIQEKKSKRTKILRGDTENDETSAPPPTPLSCEPRPTVMSLGGLPNEFYPGCFLGDRCGGCDFACVGPARYCGPTLIENATINVYRYNFVSATWDVVPVPYQKHLKCDCVCAHDASICTGRKVWNGDLCECECPLDGTNVICDPHKQWSSIQCECVCSISCGLGQILDKETCSCSNAKDSLKDSSRRSGEKRLQGGNVGDNVKWEEDTFYENLF